MSSTDDSTPSSGSFSRYKSTRSEHTTSRPVSRASDVTLVPSPPVLYNPRSSSIGYMNHNNFPLHSRLPDRPLIERVTNEWRSDPKYQEFYDKYEEDDYGQFVMSDFRYRRRRWPITCPRRPHKVLALYLLFIASILYIFHYWIRPVFEEVDKYDLSISQAKAYNRQFGANARPEFVDMVQLQYLDSRHIPGATSGSPQRLIFIGDVHGCKTELLSLLTKLDFDQSTDHLVFTGDIIFKGPDSSGVIDLARSYGASCVRGNHEDRVLLAYGSIHGTLAPMVGDQQPSQSPVTKTPTARSQPKSANAGPSEDSAHGDVRHRALAATLTRDQIEWMNKCPVILNVGRVALTMSDYVVVHAGLAPGVPLDKQDPFQVMNMRTIDLDTRVPTELRQGEPWEKVWNHFQKKALPEQRRKTVVYGHDSKNGLNILKYSKGLDSGCVKGGKLSALVVDLHGKEKVVSVKCNQDYTITQWKDEVEKLEDEGLIPKMGGVS